MPAASDRATDDGVISCATTWTAAGRVAVWGRPARPGRPGDPHAFEHPGPRGPRRVRPPALDPRVVSASWRSVRGVGSACGYRGDECEDCRVGQDDGRAGGDVGVVGDVEADQSGGGTEQRRGGHDPGNESYSSRAVAAGMTSAAAMSRTLRTRSDATTTTTSSRLNSASMRPVATPCARATTGSKVVNTSALPQRRSARVNPIATRATSSRSRSVTPSTLPNNRPGVRGGPRRDRTSRSVGAAGRSDVRASAGRGTSSSGCRVAGCVRRRAALPTPPSARSDRNRHDDQPDRRAVLPALYGALIAATSWCELAIRATPRGLHLGRSAAPSLGQRVQAARCAAQARIEEHPPCAAPR